MIKTAKLTLTFLLLYVNVALANGLIVTPSSIGTAAIGQVPAIQTNDDACINCVGAILSNSVPNNNVSLTAITYANSGAQITLTPGDWDVRANAEFVPGSTTQINQFVCSLSTVSATPNNTIGYLNRFSFGTIVTNGTPNNCLIGPARFSVATDTLVRLVVRSTFNTSTMTAGGLIEARRVR